jgi:hypothetical protein
VRRPLERERVGLDCGRRTPQLKRNPLGSLEATCHMLHDTSTQDSDPLAAVQGILRRYPQAKCQDSPEHVTVLPANDQGFAVEFVVQESRSQPTRYAVNCDGWHKEFSDFDEALSCFTSALSDSTRLEVWLRGSTPYSWTLQRRAPRGWESLGTASSWQLAFWRPRRVLYLQNHLLEAA